MSKSEMTRDMRDEIAIQVLITALGNPSARIAPEVYDQVAMMCYALADAMMKARKPADPINTQGGK